MSWHNYFAPRGGQKQKSMETGQLPIFYFEKYFEVYMNLISYRDDLLETRLNGSEKNCPHLCILSVEELIDLGCEADQYRTCPRCDLDQIDIHLIEFEQNAATIFYGYLKDIRAFYRRAYMKSQNGDPGNQVAPKRKVTKKKAVERLAFLARLIDLDKWERV